MNERNRSSVGRGEQRGSHIGSFETLVVRNEILVIVHGEHPGRILRGRSQGPRGHRGRDRTGRVRTRQLTSRRRHGERRRELGVDHVLAVDPPKTALHSRRAQERSSCRRSGRGRRGRWHEPMVVDGLRLLERMGRLEQALEATFPLLCG